MLKKLILAVILCLVPACATTLPAASSVEQRAWEYLCEVDRTFNCDGIAPPQVVYHDGLNAEFGSNGFYFPGEPIVFVRKTMDPLKKEMVLVHEMAHYLQDQTGWNKYQVWSCEWEAMAFQIGDKWAIYKGRADLVRGKNWWRPYPQCQTYGLPKAR